MKIFWWFVAFVIAVPLLFLFTTLRNAPRYIANQFRRKKRTYWHPVDWMAKEEYDIYADKRF